MTLEPIWRTDFGGPLAGAPVVVDNKIAAVSSQGDLFIVDDANTGAVNSKAKASNIDEELIFEQVFQLSPTELACLGPPNRPDLLYVDVAASKIKLLRLPPPADEAASHSVQIGTDLIVPSKQGQVVRVNAQTGVVVGTPFLPPVRPGNEMNWKKPAVIGGTFFVIAADQQVFLVDASDKTVLKQVGETTIEGTIKSHLVATTDRAFAVVSGNQTDKLVSIAAGRTSLQPGGSADLGGLALAGPWVVGKDVLLRMGDNSLVSFDSDLTRKWSVDLGPGILGEDPILENGSITLVFGDGRLRQLDPGSGNIVTESNLGQPVAHRPVAAGDGVLFAGRDGTIHNAQISN